MPVRTLTLDGFRSYEHLEIAFGDGPHVVVGRNAAGKTNLVEALVVLSTGRSHRSSADPELVRWGADFARARRPSSRAAAAREELEVVVHARGAGSGARKRVRVNGVNRRATALRPSCARSSSRRRTCSSSSARLRYGETCSTLSWLSVSPPQPPSCRPTSAR